MNDIEVGEYGRTNLGNIIIFAWLENTNGVRYENKVILIKDGRVTNEFYYFKENEKIVKHSKNIFGLLLNEDIVVLEYYIKKYARRITRRFEIFKAGSLISFNNAHCDFLYDIIKQDFLDGKGYNPKIKSIVTKEQFEQVQYNI